MLAAGPLTSLGAWAAPHLVQAANAEEAVPAPPGTPAVRTGLGTDVLLRPGAERTLPATAADRGVGPDRTSTLVLSTDPNNGDGVSAALMRGGGTTLDSLSQLHPAAGLSWTGETSRPRDDAATAALRSTAALLVGDTGADPRPELRRFGVGYVVLQQSDTAAELLAERLDAVPGLAAVGITPSGWLWRVAPAVMPDGTEDAGGRTARARILDAEGRTETLVPSGANRVETRIQGGEAKRLLVLAERADRGWHATLDGRSLEGASDGWAQAFLLPPSGGHLTVGYVSPWQPWAEAFQVAVFGAGTLLAVPVPVPARLRTVRLPPAGRAGGSRQHILDTSVTHGARPFGRTAGAQPGMAAAGARS